MKILLIDDEKLDLFIAQKQLSFNFEVAGFTSLPESLTWAKDNAFDIALIDYYLADYVTGPQALAELRKIRGNTFKAFLLTNYIDQEQVDKLLREGFTAVIFKPLVPEKLMSML